MDFLQSCSKSGNNISWTHATSIVVPNKWPIYEFLKASEKMPQVEVIKRVIRHAQMHDYNVHSIILLAQLVTCINRVGDWNPDISRIAFKSGDEGTTTSHG